MFRLRSFKMKNVLRVAVVLWVQFKPIKQKVKTFVAAIETPSLINKDSITIKSRVNIPNGYKRITYPHGSL